VATREQSEDMERRMWTYVYNMRTNKEKVPRMQRPPEKLMNADGEPLTPDDFKKMAKTCNDGTTGYLAMLCMRYVHTKPSNQDLPSLKFTATGFIDLSKTYTLTGRPVFSGGIAKEATPALLSAADDALAALEAPPVSLAELQATDEPSPKKVCG
jgi:hypothetical protein